MSETIVISIFTCLDFRCEKGLATNKYVELYSSENSNKRLADGIGFDVVNDREVLLVESSG
jgi:hypothetical protein